MATKKREVIPNCEVESDMHSESAGLVCVPYSGLIQIQLPLSKKWKDGTKVRVIVEEI